jgi:SNF2 family DNA or RNA helicase
MESTTLYPYQQRALSWMMHREARSLSERLRPDENWHRFDFVQHLQLDGMTRFWFHGALGDTRMSEPPPMKDVSGGVLADSMGLGKTVEILALVCSHPCPTALCDPLPTASEEQAVLVEENHNPPMDVTWDLFDFPDEKQKAATAARAAAAAASAVSPKDLPALQCKTTLVICPTHILDQWLTEVCNATLLDSMRQCSVTKKDCVVLGLRWCLTGCAPHAIVACDALCGPEAKRCCCLSPGVCG